MFGRAAAVRAALLMTSSTYVMYAAGLVVSALIARAVGPDDFGRYSYLVWLAGVLGMISNNGLTTTGIRFVSESLGRDSLESAQAVHGWLKRRQVACTVVVAALFLLALPFFTPSGWEHSSPWTYAGIVILSMLAKTHFLFDISIAKGYGRFNVEAFSSMGVSVLNLVAVVVLMLLKAPLMAYLLLFAMASTAYAVSAMWMMRRAGIRSSHAPLEPQLRQRLTRHLWWTVALAVAWALGNKSIETWLLNALVSSAAVGYFTIAAALTRGGVDLLSSGLTSVLMPAMAHAYGASGQPRVNVILDYSLRYFQFLGLMLAGVGVCWAQLGVTLMYGSGYQPVVGVLQIMVLVGGLTLADGAFGALLSTTDNQRLRAGFATLSIVVTAVAAIALVPRFGLTGAIAAHAMSRGLVFVVTLAAIVRIMDVRLPWHLLRRLGMAAGIAALLAYAIQSTWTGMWGGAAAGAAYAVTFTVATVLLRAWSANDADHLLAMLQRFPRLHMRLHAPIRRWAAERTNT